MTLEQTLLETLRELPVVQQQEVLYHFQKVELQYIPPFKGRGQWIGVWR